MFTDEELKPFGWARGGYWMRCKVCGDEELGVAKHSLQCRCCASQAALDSLRAKLVGVEQERDESLKKQYAKVEELEKSNSRWAESYVEQGHAHEGHMMEVIEKLTAAEQEREEFKESYRLAMVSVNDAYDKGKATAAQEKEGLKQLLQEASDRLYLYSQDNHHSIVNKLVQDRDRLAAEVKEWKHNHEQEVARARFLKERLDMPVERIKAYGKMQELQAQLATAQQSAQELFRAGMLQAWKLVWEWNTVEGKGALLDKIRKEAAEESVTQPQQSAQEQFRKGMERALEILDNAVSQGWIARNGKVRFITRGIRNHLELDDVRERIAAAIEAIPEEGV